ncbi:MAG: hypothetical protein INH41_06505 [Myxococcaceae bacterium]|nr:hypothetical protein [Myxococcaceae bacterium]MCA3012040.1 hypothetical protein [Myxococcaceae bacterium]
MARAVALCLALGALPALAGLDESFTAEERALLTEVEARRHIKARAAAEALLAKSPDSFAACWAMAKVHHDEEGNHARALWFLDRAAALLGDRDAAWGQRLLLERYDLVFEMARNQDALDALDEYEAKYGQPPLRLRIWPLFKLGRVAEAKAIAQQLAASGEPGLTTWGYNGLLSIAFEEHDRLEAHRWALAGVKASDDKSCTLLLNAGGTAFMNFRLAEAEALMVRADGVREDCAGAPYDQLAMLAVLRGEPQKALSALKTASSRPLEKRMRPQFALQRREVLAELYAAMGKDDESVKTAELVYRQPARTGMSSSPPKIERLRRTARYAFALDGLVARLTERAAVAPPGRGQASASPELVKALATRWEVRRALVQLLSEDDRLQLVLRPNVMDVGDFSAWRTAQLADAVGAGVFRRGIARARVLDEALAAAAGYFDAFEAELELSQGSAGRAVTLSTAALERLPVEEGLLRWRTHAVRAEALRRTGDAGGARADLELVMRQWPTALRVVGAPLPVTLSHDGSAAASEAATRLARSPRFLVSSEAPFRLQVDAVGAAPTICLTDRSGSRLTCTRKDSVDEALEAFQFEAFSPKVSLTDTDLRSLDGSPVRMSADEALRRALGP